MEYKKAKFVKIYALASCKFQCQNISFSSNISFPIVIYLLYFLLQKVDLLFKHSK